jgi:hypothetical protein
MEKNLKLFVWQNVLTDYTDGVMFALAPDVESAKAAILKNQDFSSVRADLERPYEVHESTVGFAVWGGG